MSNVAFSDEADFVIVGTGAGGATAARVLAGAGYSVVLLEEGPFLKTPERKTALVECMARTFRDFGTQTTLGLRPMPILQGRLVGGSTAINSAIIWRMPEDVRLDWIENYGLGELVEERGLNGAFENIERELEITETQPDVLGGNADKLAAGAKALGLPGKPITRNAAGCQGSAHCLEGCPYEARQSMDVSYVPRAMRDGARLHTMARVRKVLIKNGRALGVVGDQLDRDTRKVTGSFEVRAKRAVILSASVIFSPVILRRSGVSHMVGERFQAHPGGAVVARYPDVVGMGYGGTQAYEVPMRSRGFKIEAINLPPEMLAARLPGVGHEWQERLANMAYFSQWAAQVRMKTHGKVRPVSVGSASIWYSPSKADLFMLREGIATMCKIAFAAGAVEVYHGVARLPEVFRSPADVKQLEQHDIEQGDFHMMASHLFGTTCAHSDPKRGVVGNDLQSHEVKDLYVMDASIFPTNMGVNPQHSIMGVVWQAAQRLANKSVPAA